MEELKREVTINGYRDCPDLARINAGRVGASLVLEVGRVMARCPARSHSAGAELVVWSRRLVRGCPWLQSAYRTAVRLGRWARGPVARAVEGTAGPGCFRPWFLVIHWLGAVMAGPLVTMYPSLRHGLLLVASKGRRGVNSSPSLPGLDTCRQSRVPEGCRMAAPGLRPASLRGTPPAGGSALPVG
jgi:hypothetical protein